MNIQPVRRLHDVTIRIVPVTTEAGPSTNLLHGWTEGGRPRRASSRISEYVADTPHNRAFHIQAFIRRNAS